MLLSYDWPGNVRELANIIERAVIFSSEPTLIVDDVFSTGRPPLETTPDRPMTLKEMERTHIFKALDACNWKVEGTQGAAQQLKIAPSTLRDRMKKLGIQKPSS